MPENRIYYSQFGRKPAQLSAVVPGLGQLYNKQYLKAASAISIFTFACGLTLLLAARATVGAWFTLPLYEQAHSGEIWIRLKGRQNLGGGDKWGVTILLPKGEIAFSSAARGEAELEILACLKDLGHQCDSCMDRGHR